MEQRIYRIAIIAYDPFISEGKLGASLRLEMATIIQNEAVKNGFDDAIILDHDGFLTEATTSNFFSQRIIYSILL
ncbi:MAG: aminotransferase class IV [Candidatus Midichloria sp.]|nr:aminotransferase class IV [Candidatus Midichloria sp.]